MATKEIFIAISGVVLFLIGMVNLSGAVRKQIDVRIKEYIRYAVDKPLRGLLTGIVSTIVFQSSSASTALTISLVSAGLISFSNSLAIILGADIGTTLTVQLIIWKFTEISPLIVSIGGLLWLSGKENWQTFGEMIFYFGLMFFGLEVLGGAVEPLKKSSFLPDILNQAQNPLLGIGLGIIATALVQASAITIGMMVMLAQQDIVSLSNAVAVVMGANIGTTVTALLAGAVATRSGRRTAFSHLIFKVAGMGVCLLILPLFLDVLRNLSSSVAQQIALAHFLMNSVIVLLFIFLLKPFAVLMSTLLPGEDETLPLWPEYLDTKDIARPQKALENVLRELRRQMNLTLQMYAKSIRMISRYREAEGKSLFYIDMVVKNIRKQTVGYLRKLSAQSLSENFSRKIFAYTAMTNDIESISIHVSAINRLAFQKAQRKIKFSLFGENELNEIIKLVSENFSDAFSMMDGPSDARRAEIEAREEQVDVKVRQARDNHLERFHKRLCDPEAGPIFIEMLLHLERLSDLCNNVAEYMCDIGEN
ncbi:MAG TPA: Na/Pi cotransporter family protein [Smithella sp.]|nr:Na/Pi cotransporter family protein [Smithella sp.]